MWSLFTGTLHPLFLQRSSFIHLVMSTSDVSSTTTRPDPINAGRGILTMASLEDLKGILGPSPWTEQRNFASVELEWGISIPPDVKKVGLLYGDSLVSDFLFIFGPITMAPKGNWMSAYVSEGKARKIPRPVIPESEGMLHWGHSIDGDRLFLEDRGNGLW